jgi:hypothetical protein
MQSLRVHRGAEDALQLGAVKTAVRRPEALSVSAVDSNRMGCNSFARVAVPINQFRWFGRRRDHGVEQSEALQLPSSVCRERHRSAKFG